MRISAIFSIALVAAISLAASFTTPSGKVLQLPDVPTEYAAGSDFIPQELLQLESTKGVHADGAGRTDQWFLMTFHAGKDCDTAQQTDYEGNGNNMGFCEQATSPKKAQSICFNHGDGVSPNRPFFCLAYESKECNNKHKFFLFTSVQEPRLKDLGAWNQRIVAYQCFWWR